MIKKKVCMIGAFATGKTSLAERFVRSVFSEKYLSTVGVKIDRKEVVVGGEKLNLILWDIHGEDDFQTVRMSYLRGASGIFLVVDGTRGATLEKALELKSRAVEAVGEIPFLLLLNKVDLIDLWEVDDSILFNSIDHNLPVIKTSAKTGLGVEEAFAAMANLILKG